MVLGCTDRGVEQYGDTPHKVCRWALLDEDAPFLCACDQCLKQGQRSSGALPIICVDQSGKLRFHDWVLVCEGLAQPVPLLVGSGEDFSAKLVGPSPP
ncbi:hypothetical [Prochlorococcus marinus str. MIT 9313]|uniref:Uncharacterized protein n=1 Tax=Prochlorococcus marinus (strain MIT 9313) TaxID=74547 RepID=Q7V728_PROMM|nr:hypothetical protein [Prochlorococcus marinus]CAE21109.1 hypothetical [Prochlorococcus marinus str. MIT 9313]